jgi:hypothetical protein
MQSLLKLVLALTLVALTNSQGTKNESYALAATSATHCGTIIEGSTFDGDCCALNVTAGQGCVLNVHGGRCIVRSTQYGLSLHLILVELTPFSPPYYNRSRDNGGRWTSRQRKENALQVNSAQVFLA